MVRVVVTDKNAIYINDTRITQRDTKWGSHKTIIEFKSPKKKVINCLVARGFYTLLRKIDDEYYLKKVKEFKKKEAE